MPASADILTGELAELVAIPSISADPARATEVREAGAWVCELVRRAGGEATLLDWHGQPLAVGELAASRDAGEAPTVLVYGHFDVQPVDPLERWSSDPFTLTERDGWLYGRGVADDKGQLYMLLKAAEMLSQERRLPVNVRVVCDGEEETGGDSVVQYLAQDERGADAAVVFDSGMLRPGVPAFDVAVRGLAYFHVTLSTGDHDLHSGIFGGAALNAIHALMRTLAAVLPEEGLLPSELRAGTAAPTEEEIAGWAATLPSGVEELRSQGARPADAQAERDFHLRTWASPAVDVNGVAGGSPHLQKTVLPVEAHANVSIRLAPGQEVGAIAAAFERLILASAPEGAEVAVSLLSSSPPGLVAPDSRAVELGLDAFAAVLGRRPVLVRSGGTIPIVPALSRRGIPAIVTGFALPDSNIHSPDERLLAEYLPLGVDVARELFVRLGALTPA